MLNLEEIFWLQYGRFDVPDLDRHIPHRRLCFSANFIPVDVRQRLSGLVLHRSDVRVRYRTLVGTIAISTREVNKLARHHPGEP